MAPYEEFFSCEAVATIACGLIITASTSCLRVTTCVCVCSVVWLLYVCLTAVHLYANYRAVTAVTMDVFNQSRLHIVVGHWLTSRHVLTVVEANRREPVLTGA